MAQEKNQNPTIHHASGTVMGGPWQIRHIPQDGVDTALVADTALTALQTVDRQMSHYKPDSDLMRLNRAPVGLWVDVAADMVEVMATAAEISHFSDGALNIGLGKAINAWGFGPEPVAQTRPNCQTYIAHGKSEYYAWKMNPPSVCKQHDIEFNLSALAKGFAVDQAANAVRELGVDHFLIEAAGEIRAQGSRPGGLPWQVGLELPVPGKCLVYGQIALNNISIATSGGYRKYHQVEGQTVIHTLNPQTAIPINSDLLAVTVLNECCMRADALATALFVKGGVDGSAFADTHNIAALFLLRSDEGICEIRSRAWMDYLEMSQHV